MLGGQICTLLLSDRERPGLGKQGLDLKPFKTVAS